MSRTIRAGFCNHRGGSGVRRGPVAAGTAGVLLVLASLTSGAVATPAGAVGPAAGTVAVAPSAGPAGTVVAVSGQLAPDCAVGVPSVTIDFEGYGQTETGGVDEISAAVAADGSFTVRYRIPSVLGGSATRGLFAYPTLPGQYQFRYSAGPGCTLSPPAPFEVTGGSPAPPSFAAMAPSANGDGYWLVGADGGVFAFGDARYLGSLPGLGVVPQAPIVGIVATADGDGYWLVGADGGVFAFGDARYFGSLPPLGVVPQGPIVGIAATADGGGYWLLGADGGVFAFGDATFSGAGTTWESPFVAIGATPQGGYDLVTSHLGQLFSYPGGTKLTDEPAAGGPPLSASLSGAAVTADGDGAWQVGLDGGVFTSGDAPFEGSLPGIGVTPAAPIIDVVPTPSGGGYWLLGADGGVFSFGDAGFYGSLG